MRNLKRTIALVVSVIMMLSLFPTTGIAADDQKAADNAKTILKAIGLIDSSYTSTDVITKGKFLSIIANIYADDKTDYSKYTFFNDVPSTYQYASAVNKMASNGIIKGSQNKMAYPESAILYEEAVIYLCRMIGYGAIADMTDFNVSDYMNVATSAKILTSSGGKMGNAISSDTAMILISNALSSHLFVQKSIGRNAEYEIIEDSNMLSKYMGIYKTDGLLKAVGETKLSADIACGKDEIAVGDLVLSVNEQTKNSYIDMLGYSVTAYYKLQSKYEQEYDLVAILDRNKSSVLQIDAQDIVSVKDNKISYYDADGKLINEGFENAPYVIYNNRPSSSILPEDFNFESGYVKLVSSTGDRYDTIIIKSYSTYVVKSISPNSYIIYDRYGNQPIPEMEDEEMYYVHHTSGSKLSLSDLKEWDVLSVAKSRDINPFYEIVVSDTKVTGTVEQFATYDDDLSVTISGTEYKTSKSFQNYIKSTDANGNVTYSVSVGDNGEFLLDMFGRISGFSEKASTDFKFGIITNYAISKGVEQAPEIKVFVKDGEFITSKIKLKSNKITVNGENVSIDTFRNLVAKSGTVEPMMIRYKLSDDGRFNEFEIATDSNKGEKDGLYTIFDASNAGEFRKSQLTFSGKVNIKEDAVVFIIPTGASKGNDDYYFLKSASYFGNGSDYNRQLQVYGTKKNRLAGEAVVYRMESMGTISNSTGIGMFIDISTAVNEKDEVVQVLNVMKDGGVKKLYAMDGVDLTTTNTVPDSNGNTKTVATSTKIERGDVIRYASNAKGEITKIELVYDASNRAFMGVNTSGSSTNPLGSYTSYFRLFVGDVLVKDGNILKVQIGSNTEYHVTDKFKITVFEPDVKDGVVREGTPADILDKDTAPDQYSTIIVHTKNGDPVSMMVYNFKR